MKTKIFLMIAAMMLVLFSCQKDSDDIDQLTLDDAYLEAVSDVIFEDVFSLADNEAIQMEAKGDESTAADCPVITITKPEGALWPKTVVMDFGTGCTGFNDNTRSGKIIMVVTGPRLQVGSKRTVTFDNYYFNEIRVEGTKVFENKGYNSTQNLVVSVTLTGGKVTLPDGRTIERNVSHEREWIGGLLTPNIWDALRAILTEPKNALVKQYIKLFRMDGIELTFSNDALEYIVDKAVEFKLGARGLRSICETIMLDAMFESPSVKTNKLEITVEYASAKLEKVDLQVLKAS